VSIGGTVADAGIFRVAEDSPDFAKVTLESGTVSFRLRYSQEGKEKWAVLLVRMLAKDRIQVQIFADGAKAEFTSAAKVYIR
jgi:hypothetical protein